jgi:drug/metabolite transporter (DMT)-like permease
MEQVYKRISVTTSLVLTCLVMFIVMAVASYFSGRLKPDLLEVFNSKKLLWLLIGGIVTATLADLFIGLSIQTKNATLSGLIEISYPLFIALFAYIIYKETELNIGTIIGGSLVFIGVFLIYFFNR